MINQAIRYATVGILTNVLGYSVYLAITYLGGTPKTTMSALYATGVLISFFANRQFTFRHDGHIGRAGIRFLVAHSAGYAINFLILLVGVDKLGFAHQYVQGVAIIVVAGFLFVLLRLCVFPPENDIKQSKQP